MPPTYAPTTAPGEQRRRCRYLGIRTPLGQPPQIEILEQEVIRTQVGERVLEDLGNVPVGAFDPAETFPVRDPETDAETGQTASVGQAFALIYSWVRKQQLARDQAAAAAEAAAKTKEGPKP